MGERTAQLEADMMDTAGENEAPNANDPDDIDANGPKPIILDLDGNGISVTELAQSTHFVDGGDGLKHRTAWAAAGDGVLFYDVSGDGEITEKREYVFTGLEPNQLHPDEARSKRARAPGSVVRLSRRPFATRDAGGATGGINRAGTVDLRRPIAMPPTTPIHAVSTATLNSEWAARTDR